MVPYLMNSCKSMLHLSFDLKTRQLRETTPTSRHSTDKQKTYKRRLFAYFSAIAKEIIASGLSLRAFLMRLFPRWTLRKVPEAWSKPADVCCLASQGSSCGQGRFWTAVGDPRLEVTAGGPLKREFFLPLLAKYKHAFPKFTRISRESRFCLSSQPDLVQLSSTASRERERGRDRPSSFIKRSGSAQIVSRNQKQRQILRRQNASAKQIASPRTTRAQKSKKERQTD